MLLKSVNINGVNYVFACSDAHDQILTIQVLQPDKNLCYSENLLKHEFQHRLSTLNARVKFPEEMVRLVLYNEDPCHAEEQAVHPVSVWKLKYVMPKSAVPLKWEWHLSPMDGVQFYTKICMNSMFTASELGDQVSLLLKILKAKDMELNQYRTEGCKLRRVTAVTKPFDLESFMNEHKKVMHYASAYKEVQSIFAVGGQTDHLAAFSSQCAQNGKPKTPSSDYLASSETSSPKLANRIRKRKALDINTNHMERKVMQRRSNPQFEYKSSQSTQETDSPEEESKYEEETEDHLNISKVEIQNVETIQECISPPEASTQEPETLPITDGELAVVDRSELDELRNVLLHSADLIQKLVHKNNDEPEGKD